MFNALPNINFKDSKNFFLIAGPCAIESEQMAMDIAGRIVEITNELEIPYIFKGSFKKANRSRLDSFTGIGDEKALNILKKVGKAIPIIIVAKIYIKLMFTLFPSLIYN
jgi:2-dehydro-3-deoxyphosphooctonate aldolase (KDO 8-P synthase)